MASEASTSIFDEIGVRPVINARGYLTVLGGSYLSPRVRAAMEEANRYFVDMADLLEKYGRIVAGLLSAEAAYVTSGAAAALALGTAACMVGGDRERIARLPDTTGLKNELLIQRRHRYSYDRCPTIVGARRVEVGDSAGTTPGQIEAAIGDSTVAILHPAHLDGTAGTVALPDVLRIAHSRGIRVIVDAAGQVYPLDRMKLAAMGADLVAYGAKYFGGPHSSGVLCGRRELVESAAAQGFIGFETRGNIAFGRPMKLDRQEIFAVVVALKEWMAMDHEARLRDQDRRVQTIARAVEGVAGVRARVVEEGPYSRTDLRVTVDPAMAGRTARDVATALASGYPGILVWDDAEGLTIYVGTLTDGDEEVVAARLRAALI